jgi:hypothetical protein
VASGKFSTVKSSSHETSAEKLVGGKFLTALRQVITGGTKEHVVDRLYSLAVGWLARLEYPQEVGESRRSTAGRT